MSAPPRPLLPARYESIPGSVPPRQTRRRRRRRLRLVIGALLAVAGLFGAFMLWSVIGAWSTKGNESFSAKWADWMRAHHAAPLVQVFENYYYASKQPKKGGQPAALNALPAGSPTTPAPSVTPTTAVPAGLPAPPPIGLVVQPALPGEGVWQPVGPLVDGSPAMYEAQFRADTVYTSEITSAVWIDPTRLKVSLIPGLTEPGGSWSHPPNITPAEMPNAVAAFNGGFRFQDAHGGFFLDGRTAVPLRNGAASLVIYRDGHVDIGAWGSEVTMTPDVVAVLQNLVPMVDHGQVAASASYDDTRVWGSTLNTSIVVARSGIGVTADGALVYVAGPALTARTLAESLARAGAVRAMTLDINPEWVTFNFFSHPDPGNPGDIVASKLYPQMQRSARRYLAPVAESRDFIEISL